MDEPLDAKAAWNEGAEAFIEFIDSGADWYRNWVHGPGLKAACGDVEGKRALDLGCGHGYFSRMLAGAGARVVGVDLSDRFIARAREVEAVEKRGIEYHVLDAAAIGEFFPAASFDLVASCMAIQDMGDVPAVLGGAFRVLKAGGRMVFSIPHPCTDTPFRQWQRDPLGRKLALAIDRYFETGPAVCDWNMPRLRAHWRTPFQRFTLSQWSGMIAEAGFVIRRMHEPRPNEAMVAAHPQLEDCRRLPFFLVFEVGKLS